MNAIQPAVNHPSVSAFDVERIRADFPILQLKIDGKPLVYLDNAASSQMPQAVIVSPQFTGKNRLQQHQLVYLTLGDHMRAEIYALSMRTLTHYALV
jgi:stress-induced morphogen